MDVDVDIPANAYGESPLFEVAAFDDGHLAAEEGPGTVEDLVRVAVVLGFVGVAMARVVVGVRMA